MSQKKTYQFGVLAEKITMLFLSLKGYQILAWRYKTHFGEIDIIAKKSNEIVFVEVKARKFQTSFEGILKNRQIERVKKAAEFFISKNPRFWQCHWRFDFVVLNRFLIPKHYKNFWQ